MQGQARALTGAVGGSSTPGSAGLILSGSMFLSCGLCLQHRDPLAVVGYLHPQGRGSPIPRLCHRGRQAPGSPAPSLGVRRVHGLSLDPLRALGAGIEHPQHQQLWGLRPLPHR